MVWVFTYVYSLRVRVTYHICADHFLVHVRTPHCRYAFATLTVYMNSQQFDQPNDTYVPWNIEVITRAYVSV